MKHERVTQVGDGMWTIASSGNTIIDHLTDFFYHADGMISPGHACDLAERVHDLLIEDEDALESWGIRLTAETGEPDQE